MMTDLYVDSHTDENAWRFWDADTEDYMPPVSRQMIPDEKTAMYVARLIRQAEARGLERGAELGQEEMARKLRGLIGAASLS